MRSLTIIFLFIPLLGFSQKVNKCEETYLEIVKKVTDGELDEALILLEKTDKRGTCDGNGYYDYYKAYAHKQKYKMLRQAEKYSEAELHRKTAFQSATMAYSTYPGDRETIEQLLEYLAASYYNDAVKLINEHLPDSSYNYYKNYRKTQLLFDSTQTELGQDYKMYQSLIYQYYYLHKNTDQPLNYDNIVEIYENALAIDSSDWVLCYNYRVMQLNKMMRTPPYKDVVQTLLNSEAYWYIQNFKHEDMPRECMEQIVKFNKEFDLEEINTKADELVILDQLVMLYNRAIAFWPDLECDPKRKKL